MAQLPGVNIEKLEGGLGRLATGSDNHVAMIIGELPVGAVTTAINNGGKGVVIASLFAAEQLGINESFDANNDVKLHADVAEFFRLAPEGTLYLFNSMVEADLKSFINQNKEIKGYGVSLLYDTEESNLVSTINLNQKIINDLASENRFIDFCVVGLDGLDDYTEDLFMLTAPHVSVCIACSDDSGHIQIGSALGMIAVRKVNENMGSVDILSKPRAKRGLQDYPLTDKVLGLWLDAYLPDGRTVESINKAELNAIIGKGYIVAASYEGYAGFFFENSHTCIARNSDFAFIENNRTWNKAARIIRAALIPRVKGIVKKDKSTGFIASTTVAAWTKLVQKALEKMEINNEISGADVYIEQKQIVNNTNPVKVKATIVTDGIVHEFEVAVGLTNSI